MMLFIPRGLVTVEAFTVFDLLTIQKSRQSTPFVRLQAN
jgi:hypothetical protein